MRSSIAIIGLNRSFLAKSKQIRWITMRWQLSQKISEERMENGCARRILRGVSSAVDSRTRNSRRKRDSTFDCSIHEEAFVIREEREAEFSLTTIKRNILFESSLVRIRKFIHKRDIIKKVWSYFRAFNDDYRSRISILFEFLVTRLNLWSRVLRDDHENIFFYFFHFFPFILSFYSFTIHFRYFMQWQCMLVYNYAIASRIPTHVYMYIQSSFFSKRSFFKCKTIHLLFWVIRSQ